MAAYYLALFHEVVMPEPQRVKALRFLPIPFLLIGLSSLYSILSRLISVGGFLAVAIPNLFSLMAALAFLMASYGLRKGKPWAWWLSAGCCAYGVASFPIGIAVFMHLNATLPVGLNGRIPRFPLHHWNSDLWMLVQLDLLVLLFTREVIACFTRGALRRGWRVAWVSVSGLALTGLVFGGTFLAVPATIAFTQWRHRLPSNQVFGRGIENAHSMALSPDGGTLAVYDLNDNVRLSFLDIKLGIRHKVVLPSSPFDFCWSPDSRFLAVYLGADAGCSLVDATYGEVVWTLKLKSHHMAFHPDGSLWYLDYTDNTIWRLDVGTKDARRIIDPCLPVQGFALSPDGKRLVLAWGDHTEMSMRVIDAGNGSFLARWTDKENLFIEDLRFSEDGRRVFTSHGGLRPVKSIKVWDAATGNMDYEISGLFPINMDFRHIDLSRDGCFLSAQVEDGRHAIWSLAQRRWVWILPGRAAMTSLQPGVFSGNSQEFWIPNDSLGDPLAERMPCLRRWAFRKGMIQGNF